MAEAGTLLFAPLERVFDFAPGPKTGTRVEGSSAPQNGRFDLLPSQDVFGVRIEFRGGQDTLCAPPIDFPGILWDLSDGLVIDCRMSLMDCRR